MDWQKLLHAAYTAALESHDLSTQTGALLVGPRGRILLSDHNRLPNGVRETPERLERPLKYLYTEHAERNVIYKAARHGVATFGCTLVCTWVPCKECAEAVAKSGIIRLVSHKGSYDASPERWRAQLDDALASLAEECVETILWDGVVGAQPIRFNGTLWSP